MDELKPITRQEKIIVGENIQPITRMEKLLAGEDLEPVTRLEHFIKKYKAGGGTGGGGVSVQRKEVNFVDYDNTLLYSYTISEAQALTELPPLPTRNGLICQGWNFELEQIQQNDKNLDIGATYITDDGKTRLYITIAAEGRMEVPLYFSQTVDSGVAIDWGDGSNIERINQTGKVNITHIYSGVGSYIISLDVADDCELELGHESSDFCVLGSITGFGKVYANMLQKVEIGKKIKNISSYAFYNCYSLSSIIIPQGVTSIGSYAFYNCSSLSNIIIPQGVTSIESSAFYNCSGMYFYDFTRHTAVPNLLASNAFNNIPSDCEIRVPLELIDEWKSATNWSALADYIVAR